jgi:hypothetical protein
MKSMKKIKFLSIALLAMICFSSCSDDKVADVPVTEIIVTEATADGVTVKALDTSQLTVTTLPADATYKRVLFKSSDNAIATVNAVGLITGVKRGVATITVYAADSYGVSVSFTVNVDYGADITNVKTPGTLSQLLGNQTGITSLKLAGTLNGADFETLTNMTDLQTLDMSLTTVTAIPDNAFYGSASTRSGKAGTRSAETLALASVNLPATVASIGENAFRDCTNLTSVTLEATTPPTVATGAFGRIDLAGISLSVPTDAADAYKEVAPWKNMKVNGAEPATNTVNYTIPIATGVGAWQTVTLETPLSTTDEWTIVATSTQPSGNISQIVFGGSGWGIHLFNIDFTGTPTGDINGNNPPFEFYLGAESQSGTKVGAIGRANWKNSTQSLTPFAITLNAPVTITLTCTGDGNIRCTVQNSGVNGGDPIDFGTIGGVETVTAVKAAVPVTTAVAVTVKE